MVDLRARLAGRAFETIPGSRYNRYRETAEARPGLFYEVPLADDVSWRHLADHVWPTLARYLDEKGIDPEEPRSVVIAVFLGPTCYLLRAEEFRDLFCEIEGLTRPAFHFRLQRWRAGTFS